MQAFSQIRDLTVNTVEHYFELKRMAEQVSREKGGNLTRQSIDFVSGKGEKIQANDWGQAFFLSAWRKLADNQSQKVYYQESPQKSELRVFMQELNGSAQPASMHLTINYQTGQILELSDSKNR